MGVSWDLLPKWDDVQILTAQFAKKPLMEDVKVDTKFVIGPQSARPLAMDIPIFVSDTFLSMPLGALAMMKIT